MERTLMGWLGELLEAVRRQRSHAPFFSWYDRSARGKAVAELGVVSSLFESMTDCPYKGLRPGDMSWPDCEAVDAEGRCVGIEVTECVDSQALARSMSPRPWREERLIARLQELIDAKDRKAFHGGKYRKVILVIHTDELFLAYERVMKLVERHVFQVRYGNLDEVFLLFSYSPRVGRCPFLRLTVAMSS